MVAGEATQQKGYDHVKQARRWLDSTTRVRILWDVYEYKEGMELTPVKGPVRAFDLRGVLVDEDGKNGPPLWVECKGYEAGPGNQGTQYPRFLANCYSVTQAIIDEAERSDPRHEFMWITWHPFSQTKWAKLRTGDEVESAIEKHKDEVLGDRTIDKEVVRLVAERLWLLILSDRHDELMMSKYFLGKIRDLATQEEAV